MTTKQDVLLAILALDAYNRGANPGVAEVDGTKLATQIGTAQWQYASSEKLPSVSERPPGFAGVAVEV